MNLQTFKHKNGFGLIEIIIAVAIVGGTLVYFLHTGVTAIKLLRSEKANMEMALLAQEAIEAVRLVRDETWVNISSLSNGIPYYPVIENGKWKMSTTSPGLVYGKYNRYVVFGQVSRNSQDRIASSGTVDPDTRKLTAYATTTQKSVVFETYITNFHSGLSRPKEKKEVFFEDAPTNADLTFFPSSSGEGDPAQSFTILGTNKVTKVELFMRKAVSFPSDLYVELRSSPTGAVLGTSNIILASTLSTSTLQWVNFRFPDPVALAAGTYFIRVRSLPSSTDNGSGASGPVYWGYRQTPSSPYAGGDAYRYIGRLSDPNYNGELLDQYDFGFRVYVLE